MPRWVQFAALFMLTFVVFDVCSPESCEAQLSAPIERSMQFQAQQNAGGDSCQFEEDCFNCAHYAPGIAFVVEPIAVVAFQQPDLFVPSLEQPLLLPYHPPRA